MSDRNRCSTSDVCLCRASGTLPETRAALEKVAALTALDPDLEVLALLGTGFEDALISTRNAGALVMGRGGYGPTQRHGTRLRLVRKRINLRIGHARGASLARVEGTTGGGERGALVVLDGADKVVHRVQYRSRVDEKIGRSLDPQGAPDCSSPDGGTPDWATDCAPGCTPDRSVTADAAPDDTIIPLTAIRNARMRWDEDKLSDHLDLVLSDGGATRSRCLPHVGTDRARRVEAGLIPSFFAFLAEHAFPFTRAVPSQGILQFDIGCITALAQPDGVLVSQTERGAFSLDLDSIGSVWVTTMRGCAALELYDHAARNLAVLFADPWAEASNWADALAPFPTQR